MIVFACSGCQLRLKVGDNDAGKRVKCPRCARAVAVPAPAAVASESATLPPDPARRPTPMEAAGPDAFGGGGPAAPGATEAGPLGLSALDAAVPPQLANHPRYRVVALLGQGGMGAVYKAEHRRMERPVALKVVNPSLVGDDAAVRRFHQEVKAAARLHHPHIVTAFDADQAGGLHFLVMEFVEGQSLADYLREKGPLPPMEACRYVRQAALGLQHAHEQGMVHRDVKPHNLMRTPQGQIKILDFGLARLAAVAEAPGQSQLTGAGAIMGTADYIAPEQASDAHTADIRADIYSLGCTLYQLLTGRVPFPSGSMLDKIVKHSVDEPTPVLTLRPDLPLGLAAVTAKMMAKKPADRYRVPAEVAKALAPFATAGLGTAKLPPRAEPVTDRTAIARPPAPRRARPGRRSPWKWLVAAAGLAVVVGVALAAAVYRISTDQGDLVITPESPDVDVVVSQNGKQVEIVDTKTTKRIQLPSGAYDLSLQGDPDGLKLSTDRITVRRGDTVLATVQFLPKADPNVLVVAADGSGGFRSVREALLEARDGMTIRIKPGTYKEATLVVHKDVTVEGDGPAGSVIMEPSGEDGFGIQSLAAHAVFRNLTVRAQAATALAIDKGGATVEDCTFTLLKASKGTGVAAIMADAKARFLRSTMKSNPEGCGVIVLGTSEATLEDCEVFDNAYQGIWVGGDARATARKCRIHDGKENGVYLNGKGQILVEDCEITGNAQNGVECDGDGAAVVRRCHVNRNLQAGLSALDRGSITADGCDLDGNLAGPTDKQADGKISETPPAKPK